MKLKLVLFRWVCSVSYSFFLWGGDLFGLVGRLSFDFHSFSCLIRFCFVLFCFGLLVLFCFILLSIA